MVDLPAGNPAANTVDNRNLITRNTEADNRVNNANSSNLANETTGTSVTQNVNNTQAVTSGTQTSATQNESANTSATTASGREALLAEDTARFLQEVDTISQIEQNNVAAANNEAPEQSELSALLTSLDNTIELSQTIREEANLAEINSAANDTERNEAPAAVNRGPSSGDVGAVQVTSTGEEAVQPSRDDNDDS